MNGTNPDVAGALKAMRATPARGRGRKSAAALWLFARHDALAKAFKENPPSWTALADYLGKHGVHGADGKAPTAIALRSAWSRIQTDLKKRRAKGAPKRRTPAETTTEPQSPSFLAGPQDDGDTPPVPNFDRPIRAR